MKTAWRRRGSWAIAASVVAHLAVLTAAQLHKSTLPIPVEAGGPPEAIIPLLILPRAPSPKAGSGLRPAPIQLHRRPQRNLPGEAAVAPILVPVAKPAETPAPVRRWPETRLTAIRTPGRRTRHPARDARLRTRTSPASIARVASSAWDGRRATSPIWPLGCLLEKRALLDQAGALKMQRKLAAEHPLQAEQGLRDAPDYSGEPDVATNAVDAPSHPPRKRAARVLKQLPP